ncbi:MAG: methionyl-tRNA formyltransferase [Acidimicrobiales bacterium]
MRIVFMGYGALGANLLRAIAERHDVVLVFTHPVDFGGLGEDDVQRLGEALRIPLMQSRSAADPKVLARLRDVSPEAIVSTNWRTTLPREVLRIPTLGAINVHDALLPRYAGFGAVNWAIRNGETETGLTVHLMDDELDTGPILAQTTVPIAPNDTAAHVLDALVARYPPIALRALELLRDGDPGRPQTGPASFYHRIGPQDTYIDWRLDTTTLHDLVRGQSDPFHNAWTRHQDRPLRIKTAAIPRRAYCGTPGRVIKAAEGGVAVACGSPRSSRDARGLILLDVQRDNDAPVRARDYFVRFGDHLGSSVYEATV